MECNLIVKENIGTSSVETFGNAGTQVKIRMSETSARQTVYQITDRSGYKWSCFVRRGNSLEQAINTRFGDSDKYRTVFTVETNPSILLNDVKRYDWIGKKLLEYIQESIQLEANPIIKYNNRILEKDNMFNNLIKIKKDDVIEILYGETVEFMDIGSLIRS